MQPPVLPSQVNIDDAIIQAQQDVKRLQERVRVLKTCKNAINPIGRLSNEALLHIMSLVREGDRRTHCWIRLTHVCKRWRNIALGYPMFWTYISGSIPLRPISDNSRLCAFLGRSRSCSLEVNGVRRDRSILRSVLSE